ncbi:MAG TPA: phosphatase PAP2 family protein [Candidatus Kapabacteria bacterium]|nr:phosphatase PAP2 family protein [Candidatus Kapabacteria bacterium]
MIGSRARLIFATVLVVCSASNVKADTTRSVFQIIGSDLEKAGKKSLLFLSSPFRATGSDYLYLAGGAMAQIGLIAIDDETTPWLDRNLDLIRLNAEPNIWKFYGERDYAIAAVLATYTTGLIIDDENTRRIARMCGESLLFSAIIGGATKVIAGRSRPAHGDNWEWNIWETDDAHQSFPSGHTTIAFTLSSVLAEEIDNNAIDIGLYTLAALTGLSRIVDGRHWFADVVGGAAIGTLCGIFVSRNEYEVSEGEDESVRLLPHGSGLTLQYKF